MEQSLANLGTKGHAGLADNERCDTLAMAACRLSDLPPDPDYVEDISEVPAKEEGTETAHPGANRKITTEGQPCRHCGTPVIRRAPRQRKLKEGQTYYFAWYLYCPGCKAMYMVEEAKQHVGSDEGRRDEVDGSQLP